ncbi:hypothetical protein BP5796_01391 [Coleophoma crateriformis]|uniref:Uncharacterized protein n=1 Tax=Coleophoma crateriformis TaxID=565419 RepID=A0A3D8T094_9HELO|nr:hypothetical protein BP5796_01391 [Coleophoma crateriformis]
MPPTKLSSFLMTLLALLNAFTCTTAQALIGSDGARRCAVPPPRSITTYLCKDPGYGECLMQRNLVSDACNPIAADLRVRLQFLRAAQLRGGCDEVVRGDDGVSVGKPRLGYGWGLEQQDCFMELYGEAAGLDVLMALSGKAFRVASGVWYLGEIPSSYGS